MHNLQRPFFSRRPAHAPWRHLEHLESRTLLSASLATPAPLGKTEPIPAITTPASTTLTLTLGSGGAALGDVTFHVAATGSPTGLVDLFEGNVWRTAGTLTNGVANLTPAHLFHGGNHVFTVRFHGSSAYAPATSTPLTVNFTPLATQTTLAVTLTTVSEMQKIKFTATATGSVRPVGKVIFYDQETPIGSSYLDIFGHASISYAFGQYGSHAITARYQGVADMAPSDSAPLAETVLRTARSLCFTQSIATVAAGDTFNLALGVMDCQSTLIANDSCSLSLSIVAGSGGGTLVGTRAAQAQNGVATFNGLTFTAPGTYTLRATDGSIAFGDLASIIVTPPATHISILAATSSATIAGQLIAPVTVQFLDSKNNLVPKNEPVTIALTKANGATLAGTLTVEAHDGTAVFNDLSVALAGTYTLTAQSADFTTTSKKFTVIPDAASSRLVIATQPAGVPLNTALPAITINIVDQFNNLITQDSSIVTLGIATGPTGATLNGKLTAKFVKGVAKFTGIKPQLAGAYTLSITDGTLTPVITNAFTVSGGPI